MSPDGEKTANHGNGNHKTVPYLDGETLIIPFACSDHRYKYWKKEGMPISDILKELDVPSEVWIKYTGNPRPEDQPAPEE